MENMGGYFAGAMVAWFGFLASVLVIDAWLDGYFRDKVKRWLSDLQSDD